MIYKIKNSFKLYLLERKLRRLNSLLDSVGLNLYDGWDGAECIKETKYLQIVIKEQEFKIQKFKYEKE